MSDEWWRQWVYLTAEADADGAPLHRLKTVEWLGWASGPGVMLCGGAGDVWVPGVTGRTQAPRCPKCCELAGVPQGVGNPHNDPKPEGA
jgi:hypothetical protein